jgi:ribosomal protein S18 acetylase RimI-like enzyme
MKTRTPVLDSSIRVQIERNEWLYWQVLYQQSGSAAVTDPTRPYFIGAIPEVDVLAYNRVIGLGLEEPATHSQIKSILRFFSGVGVNRFFVQVSPFARPKDLIENLEKNGLKYYNHWAKLYRKTDVKIPEPDTNVNIIRIDEDYADLFGEIIVQPFGWDSYKDILSHLLSKTVGQPGYHHYLAVDGDTPIAAASLYVNGDYGSLAMAGTLEKYRGRGAQSALLARRIQDARDMGCRYLFSETAEDTPEKGSASFRNLRRFGFKLAYLRPNYICQLG